MKTVVAGLTRIIFNILVGVTLVISTALALFVCSILVVMQLPLVIFAMIFSPNKKRNK